MNFLRLFSIPSADPLPVYGAARIDSFIREMPEGDDILERQKMHTRLLLLRFNVWCLFIARSCTTTYARNGGFLSRDEIRRNQIYSKYIISFVTIYCANIFRPRARVINSEHRDVYVERMRLQHTDIEPISAQHLYRYNTARKKAHVSR